MNLHTECHALIPRALWGGHPFKNKVITSKMTAAINFILKWTFLFTVHPLWHQQKVQPVFIERDSISNKIEPWEFT